MFVEITLKRIELPQLSDFELMERHDLRNKIVNKLRFTDIFEFKTDTLEKIWNILNIGG